MIARGIMKIITIPDEDVEDTADLLALREAKAEEENAPTMSLEEVKKGWGLS